MSCRLLAACLIVCSVGPVAAPVASAQDLKLAGSGERLWLVRVNEDEAPSFDVLTYRAGDRWTWVARGLPGGPTVVAAGREQLHVLIGAEDEYLIVRADDAGPTVGPNLPKGSWASDAAPLSACTARDFAGMDGWSFVVVAPRNAPPSLSAPQDSLPLSPQPVQDSPEIDSQQPSLPPPGPVGRATALTVLQCHRGQWRHLTDLGEVELSEGSVVHAAAVGDRLYLLIGEQVGGNRLWVWQDQPDTLWTQINLSGDAGSGRVLSMFAAFDRLTMVLAVTGERELLEIIWLDPADQPSDPQVITLAGEPFRPPAIPLAAPLDVSPTHPRLALLWREDQTAKFSLCDVANGAAEPAGDVEALELPPPDTSGGTMMNYFLVVMVSMTFVVMIAARPKMPPGPVMLPGIYRPASLGKRVLAGMIDLLPISFIVSIVVNLPELPMDQAGNFRELWDTYSQAVQTSQAAYSVIATFCTYMVYGMVMEARFSATLGKMAMKIRVIGGDGQPPGLRAVALRNLVKMLEMSLPWLLVLVPLLNPARQRLGDILARTVVVERAPGGQELPQDPHEESTDQRPGDTSDDS